MKSVVLPAATNMILMIVLLVVGSVILLKVFKIDIDKVIGELFGTRIIEPTPGKALHVKTELDKQDERVELWEFHLTNSPLHEAGISKDQRTVFFLGTDFKAFPKEQCVIYMNVEQGRDSDKGWVYYVNQGTRIISNECDNIYECIKDRFVKNQDEGCVPLSAWAEEDLGCKGIYCRDVDNQQTDCAGKFHYVNCDTLETIRKEDCDRCSGGVCSDEVKFGNPSKPPADCGKDICCKNHPLACELLQSRSTGDGISFQYKLKYGLICGPDENKIIKWIPCTRTLAEDIGKSAIDVGNQRYGCDWDSFEGVGRWVTVQTIT